MTGRAGGGAGFYFSVAERLGFLQGKKGAEVGDIHLGLLAEKRKKKRKNEGFFAKEMNGKMGRGGMVWGKKN